MIFNPGALAHAGVALRDALLAVQASFYRGAPARTTAARESFRHHSYFADIAVGSIVGLGAPGYEFAVPAAAARLPPPDVFHLSPQGEIGSTSVNMDIKKNKKTD